MYRNPWATWNGLTRNATEGLAAAGRIVLTDGLSKLDRPRQLAPENLEVRFIHA
jgi:hypothetical protein